MAPEENGGTRAPADEPKGKKQPEVPGMSDRKLADLHAAAEAYADVRDRRMKLTDKEVEAKAEVLRLMKLHKRKEYRYRDGDELLEIEIIPEGEKIKVKITEAD